MTAADAVTSICTSCPAGFRVTSIFLSCPTTRSTLVVLAVEKLLALTVREYVATFNAGKKYCPCSFVVAVLSSPVLSFLTTTVAPTIAPPFSSLTTPLNLALSVWPRAREENPSSSANANTTFCHPHLIGRSDVNIRRLLSHSIGGLTPFR